MKGIFRYTALSFFTSFCLFLKKKTVNVLIFNAQQRHVYTGFASDILQLNPILWNKLLIFMAIYNPVCTSRVTWDTVHGKRHQKLGTHIFDSNWRQRRRFQRLITDSMVIWAKLQTDISCFTLTYCPFTTFALYSGLKENITMNDYRKYPQSKGNHFSELLSIAVNFILECISL